MQSSALMMTCHSGEDVIAFGMPSAKRTSPLSASPEPLLHTVSRCIDVGEESVRPLTISLMICP